MWGPKNRNLEELKEKNIHENSSNKIYKFKNIF